jgi:hypothetical protein
MGKNAPYTYSELNAMRSADLQLMFPNEHGVYTEELAIKHSTCIEDRLRTHIAAGVRYEGDMAKQLSDANIEFWARKGITYDESGQIIKNAASEQGLRRWREDEPKRDALWGIDRKVT